MGRDNFFLTLVFLFGAAIFTICPLESAEEREYPVEFIGKDSVKFQQEIDLSINFEAVSRQYNEKKDQRFKVQGEVAYFPEGMGFRVIEKVKEREFFEGGKRASDPEPDKKGESMSTIADHFPPNFIFNGKKGVKVGDKWDYDRSFTVEAMGFALQCQSAVTCEGLEKYQDRDFLMLRETAKLTNRERPSDKGTLEAKYWFDPESRIVMKSETTYSYRTYMNVEFINFKEEVPLNFKFRHLKTLKPVKNAPTSPKGEAKNGK